MKPYVKKVVDTHPYIAVTNRRKEHKTPKASATRVGKRTAVRMQLKRNLLKLVG